MDLTSFSTTYFSLGLDLCEKLELEILEVFPKVEGGREGKPAKKKETNERRSETEI